MDEQNIEYLVERLQTGAITASELTVLRQLLLSDTDRERFINLMAEQMEQASVPANFDAGNWEEAVERIIAIDQPVKKAKVKSITRKAWWIACSRR